LAAEDTSVVTVLEEPLWTLARRYERATHEVRQRDLDHRAHALLAEHAPQTLDRPGEPALLRSAEDRGWDLNTLVPTVAGRRSLDRVEDATAVLQWRIRQHIDSNEPPAHATADPGEHPLHGPLPWLEPIDPATLEHQPELAEHLGHVGAAMVDRAIELRRHVADNEPAWAAELGARPAEPAAAKRWDELAGIAAAYRETYRISRTDPGRPLGPQPRDGGAEARAWKQITANWRPPMTTSDDAFSANQDLINTLRDQVLERADDREQHTEQHTADTEDELADARAVEAVEEYDRLDEEEHLDDGFGSGLRIIACAAKRFGEGQLPVREPPTSGLQPITPVATRCSWLVVGTRGGARWLSRDGSRCRE
jgi:hypothetical protein